MRKSRPRTDVTIASAVPAIKPKPDAGDTPKNETVDAPKDIARRHDTGDARAGGRKDAEPIFNGKNLDGWYIDSNGGGNTWRVEDGDLVVIGTGNPRKLGWLLSERSFSEFILRFEFQLSKGANSGVALRAAPGERVRNVPVHLEVSLWDAANKPEETGTVLWSANLRWRDCLALNRPSHLKPVGSWNEMEIELRGQALRVRINDDDVLQSDLSVLAGRYQALPALSREWGRIGFQAHTGTVRCATSGSRS